MLSLLLGGAIAGGVKAVSYGLRIAVAHKRLKRVTHKLPPKHKLKVGKVTMAFTPRELDQLDRNGGGRIIMRAMRRGADIEELIDAGVMPAPKRRGK